MRSDGIFQQFSDRNDSICRAISTMALHCGSPSGEKQEGGVQKKSIEVVQNEHTDALMSIPGVVGTAIGDCIGLALTHPGRQAGFAIDLN